jgi:hypothetical protein
MSVGRTYARITRFCLEWTILPALSATPKYPRGQIEQTDTLFMPAHDFVNFFGLGHAANPIILTASDRQRIATGGESFWVYGFVRYESFADEAFELGFIARWEPGHGLVAEANQNYAYRRKRSA